MFVARVSNRYFLAWLPVFALRRRTTFNGWSVIYGLLLLSLVLTAGENSVFGRARSCRVQRGRQQFLVIRIVGTVLWSLTVANQESALPTRSWITPVRLRATDVLVATTKIDHIPFLLRTSNFTGSPRSERLSTGNESPQGCSRSLLTVG